jgi:hypothetical protein
MTDNQENDDLITVDELAEKNNLIDCYQIQVNDKNIYSAVYLGKYPEIPLPVNKIINYGKYKLFVVTYILTKHEIDNNKLKILGVNIVKDGQNESSYSLDLIAISENKYQLVFSNHIDNTSIVVENIEIFPKKDKVLEYIIEKTFEDPVKEILLE